MPSREEALATGYNSGTIAQNDDYKTATTTTVVVVHVVWYIRIGVTMCIYIPIFVIYLGLCMAVCVCA